MHWEAISAVGEALGALAVVASLIYLATQIRQNSASIRASTYDSALSQATNLHTLLLTNEALTNAWIQGLNAPDELDTINRLRFNSYMLRLFRMIESFHRQAAGGVLDPEVFDVSWSEILEFADKPGVASWWQSHRQQFTKSFRNYVEQELESIN